VHRPRRLSQESFIEQWVRGWGDESLERVEWDRPHQGLNQDERDERGGEQGGPRGKGPCRSEAMCELATSEDNECRQRLNRREKEADTLDGQPVDAEEIEIEEREDQGARHHP
jgi:hypothetical protein